MLYRVQASFIFTDEDEARDFYHDCLMALPKATTINKGQPDEEHSVSSWHTCTHADPATAVCVLTASDQSP